MDSLVQDTICFREQTYTAFVDLSRVFSCLLSLTILPIRLEMSPRNCQLLLVRLVFHFEHERMGEQVSSGLHLVFAKAFHQLILFGLPLSFDILPALLPAAPLTVLEPSLQVLLLRRLRSRLHETSTSSAHVDRQRASTLRGP